MLQVEDDHSRFILASHVARAETSEAAITVVSLAIGRHGAPTRFLTDNGAAFNQSRRGGTSQLEAFLRRQGVTAITGRPGKPTTQGKNERLHQTLGKFLDANRPIRTTGRLTQLVEEFDQYYNTQGAHQWLDPDQTPAQAYQARPKAVPATPEPTAPPTPEPPKPQAPRTSPISGIHRRTMGQRPVCDTLGAARWADRKVSTTGRIYICNAKIDVGTRLIGHTLHVLFDATTIEIFDPDGTLLGHVPHPGTAPAGTTKVLTIRPWPTRHE